MANDTQEYDLPEVSNEELNITDSPVDEEVPFVEVPKSRRLEDWVVVVSWSIASPFSMHSKEAFSTIEDLDPSMRPSWGEFTPKSDNRICSVYPGSRFAMYGFLLKEVRLRLLLTNLQRSVFGWLQLSPSPLHPNAIYFLWAFEIVCIYLDVGPNLPLFLRVFHLQWLCDTDGKDNWVSFKQPKNLFTIYQDSVKHFKSRFFIVKPLTPEVEDHLFDIVDYVKDEEK